MDLPTISLVIAAVMLVGSILSLLVVICFVIKFANKGPKSSIDNDQASDVME